MPSNQCSVYDNKDFALVAVTNSAVALISLLACIFAISIVILFKKWKFFSQRLILYLIISAMLNSVVLIIRRLDYNNGFCIFTAFTGQVTTWMVLLAISVITVYLFLRAVYNKNIERYEILCLFFIFAFPVSFSWIPFVKNTYGHAGVWCWIRTLNEDCSFFVFGQVLQLVLFYIPIFTILLILITLYLIILWNIQSRKKKWTGLSDLSVTQQSAKKHDKLQSETLFLLVYPLIYFILSIPLIINRIQSWANPLNPSLVLWYLSGITHPLQGGIISLAFTLDSKTRHRLKWPHIRAAIKNYGGKKVVSEYTLGETEVNEESQGEKDVSASVLGDTGAAGESQVHYKQLTDAVVLDKLCPEET